MGTDSNEENVETLENEDVVTVPDEEVTETEETTEEVDTSHDVTEDTPDDSYVNALGKVADACWEVYGGKSDYVNTANGVFESLKEIANGIRGAEPDLTDEEVLKKQPKTFIQLILSIRNAIKGVDDDFSAENEEVNPDDVEVVTRPSIMDVLTILDGSKDLLGKTTKELCTVKFFDDNLVGGVINYVEDYTGFNSDVKEQNGYYVAFGFEANDDIASMSMFVVDSKNEKPVVNCDTENVLFLGKSEDEAKKKSFVLTGYDANGKKVSQKLFKLKNVNFVKKEVTEEDTE